MEFQKEFEIAQKVIKEAGKMLFSQYDKHHTISFKIDSSIVTQVDKEIEKFISARLTSIFPTYGFIGEEGAALDNEIAWIVDPIDGTVAFTRQIPEFGIAIAFKKGKEVIFSVQYIPITDILLTAYKNQGAYCNGNNIHVSKTKETREMLISFGVQNLWRETFQDYTLKLVNSCRFRVGHSSVVESYYLASGKTDIFVRFDQPIYDIAAQYLLMKEAGAVVTDEYGNPLQLNFNKSAKHNIIATNQYMNKTYKDILYFSK